MNVDIYNPLPPVLPRYRTTTLNTNNNGSIIDRSCPLSSSASTTTTLSFVSNVNTLPNTELLSSSSTFTLNTPTETTTSPLSTHLSDIVTCIAEMLTLDDLRSLVCTNKDWSTCFNVSRYMHTLRFTDLHLASSSMTTTTTVASSKQQQHPCDLPEPNQMIRLSRLDLTGYIHTGSPSRTKFRLGNDRSRRSQSSSINNNSSTAPSSITTTASSSLVSSLMGTPNNRHSNEKLTRTLLEISSNVLQSSSIGTQSSSNSDNDHALLPRTVTLSTEIPYTLTNTSVPESVVSLTPSSSSSTSSVNPISSLVSSSSSSSSSPQSWLSKFLQHKDSCLRLQVLKCSTTVPRYLQEYLFMQCTNIRSLSLRSCEMTDDTLLMKINAKHNLRAIDLHNCWRITDEGLQFLLESCPNMEKALFDGVWKITDTIIDQLSVHWPRLSVLEITGSHHNISYMSVMNLLIKHKNLRALRLSNMHFEAGNEGWYEIFRACIYAVQHNALQVIEISQAPYLTNATLEYYCSQIQQENVPIPLQVIVKSCLTVSSNQSVSESIRNGMVKIL